MFCRDLEALKAVREALAGYTEAEHVRVEQSNDAPGYELRVWTSDQFHGKEALAALDALIAKHTDITIENERVRVAGRWFVPAETKGDPLAILADPGTMAAVAKAIFYQRHETNDTKDEWEFWRIYESEARLVLEVLQRMAKEAV